MGTKLEYAINALVASPNSSIFGEQFVDVLDYLHTGVVLSKEVTWLDKFRSKMPNNHNIDAIKRTMQMHEDIFKRQVRELHRLYSVQRMLMDELKKETKQNGKKHWNPITSSPDTSRTPLANRHNSTLLQTTCVYAQNGQLSRDEFSSGERSGSWSEDTVKTARGFDLERLPTEEDYLSTGVCVSDIDDNHQAGPSPSLCMPQKSNNNVSELEDEVELTLSIGGGTNKKMYKKYRSLDHFQEFGFPETIPNHKDMKDLLDQSPAAHLKSHSGKDCCSGPATAMSSSSATFDQKRKGPHWLFQGLSINRT